MPTIRNMNDMNKVLQPYIIKAMELTRDEIFEVVSRKVSDYYNEPVFDGGDTPMYQRTGHLRDSLTGSNVTCKNNIYSFTVGWDDEYIEYTYSGWTRRWRRGLKGKNYATGEDVLNYFNTGRHGGDGFTGDHNYWDEAIDELGGSTGLVELFKRNCKKVGLPIIN